MVINPNKIFEYSLGELASLLGFDLANANPDPNIPSPQDAAQLSRDEIVNLQLTGDQLEALLSDVRKRAKLLERLESSGVMAMSISIIGGVFGFMGTMHHLETRYPDKPEIAGAFAAVGIFLAPGAIYLPCKLLCTFKNRVNSMQTALGNIESIIQDGIELHGVVVNNGVDPQAPGPVAERLDTATKDQQTPDIELPEFGAEHQITIINKTVNLGADGSVILEEGPKEVYTSAYSLREIQEMMIKNQKKIKSAQGESQTTPTAPIQKSKSDKGKNPSVG